MIEIFPCGPVNTNTLLVYCAKEKEGAIVDPALGSTKSIKAFVEKHGLKPTKVLLTHSHWDHIADLKELVDLWPMDIYVHPLDAPNVAKPGSDGLKAPISIQGVAPTHLVSDGEIITVGTIRLQVIETPGHTPGGICFYIPEEGLLISGDTLFQHSYGRLDLPTARPTAMISSLEKLSRLPDATVVFPGHGPKTTIAHERWIKDPRKTLNM